MNQPRAQRYLLAILALAGLFLGSNLGAFADQFTGATMETQVVLAYRDCTACRGAILDFAAEAFKVNRWLLTGAGFGLLLSLAVYWAVRMVRPASAGGAHAGPGQHGRTHGGRSQHRRDCALGRAHPAGDQLTQSYPDCGP